MNQVIPMKVNWYNMKDTSEHNLHYGVYCQHEDMGITVLCTLWDNRKGILFVYDGWRSEDPAPKKIVAQSVARMHFKDYLVDKLIGNDLFWENRRHRGRTKGKTLVRMYNDEFIRARVPHVRIARGVRDDLYGTRIELDQMWKMGRIYVNNKLEDVIREFREWSIDDGQPQDNQYYCEGLCIVAGELKKAGVLRQAMNPVLRDYTKAEVVQQMYRNTSVEAIKARNRGMT